MSDPAEPEGAFGAEVRHADTHAGGWPAIVSGAHEARLWNRSGLL